MPLYPQGGGLYPNSIDNVLLADMAQATVKGRAAGAGAGDPQDLTSAQLSLLLGGPNFRNILGRNGGFEVWQRGAGGSASWTPTAGAQQYVADGWFFVCGANQASNILQLAGLTNGSRYCGLFGRQSGQTGVGGMTLEYPLDADEIVPMRGSIVTLSLTLVAGPNWSPVGGNINLTLAVGTGAPARRTAVAYTGETTPITVAQPITAVPTRYSFTSSVIVPVNTTQASLLVQWTPVGTAGASDWFEIDDVQLEVGSFATPFERRPFESELQACKRHFWKTFQYGTAPAQAAGRPGAFYWSQTAGAGAAVPIVGLRHPVSMRVSPTLTAYNPSVANNLPRNQTRGTDYTTVSFDAAGSPDALAILGTTPGGSAAGDACELHITADAGI